MITFVSMKISDIIKSTVGGVVLLSLMCCSCGNGPDALQEDAPVTLRTSDMDFFELRDSVKICRRTTYLDVRFRGDTFAVDTLPAKRVETAIYFDRLGHYIKKRHERLTRDSLGRITRWEDRRPNYRTLHGGILKDTLGYVNVNPHVMTTSGMGDFSVVVRDTLGNIVGQYSDPYIQGTSNAAFNVIRRSDDRGNWTERLTVWTTQSPDGRPHVSYTIDTREITYYNPK